MEWSVFADTVMMTVETTIIRESVHQTLPETYRDGSVFFRQQHWKPPQSQGQCLLHRNQNSSPFPPFLSWRPPSADVAGDAHRSSGQQGARHNNVQGSIFSSKGSTRYHVGLNHPVCQSPFSSSFCRLFCIFSNLIMLAVSSWQRTSTFNCTCDPRPDGAVCSWWVSTMEVSDPSLSSRVLILYLM